MKNQSSTSLKIFTVIFLTRYLNAMAYRRLPVSASRLGHHYPAVSSPRLSYLFPHPLARKVGHIAGFQLLEVSPLHQGLIRLMDAHCLSVTL